MLPLAAPVHLAAGQLQRGKQAGSAVALVVVSHLGRDAWTQRRQRCGAIKRLDLGLFVHAQHQSPLGRVQVKADNVSQPGLKLGVGAELEMFQPMWLQTVFLLDPVNGCGAQPDLHGQPPGIPMGGSFGRAHGCRHHAALLGWRDTPEAPAARLGSKSSNAQLAITLRQRHTVSCEVPSRSARSRILSP
jgi:hypothetical protein